MSDYYLDRIVLDFVDEQPYYTCSCGGWKTQYPQNYSVCPYCGAPVETEEA